MSANQRRDNTVQRTVIDTAVSLDDFAVLENYSDEQISYSE